MKLNTFYRFYSAFNNCFNFMKNILIIIILWFFFKPFFKIFTSKNWCPTFYNVSYIKKKC